MAGSILIPLKTVLDDKGIKDAQASFGKLGSSLKGVLAAAGIGIGIGAITSALQESTKAAGEDVKSQAMLAQQLRNTVGASKEQIASVEASIKTMQNQAAVADDVIRPAFASLVRSTGDVGEATRLTNLALDVAAGTGKDLGSVAMALGKSVNGSNGALVKLIPSLKNAVDPMAELQKQFNGAAAAAADADPYAQLSVVFGDIQEQIGSYLLPYLKQFAEYVSSPEGQKALGEFADGVGTIASNVVTLGKNLNSGEFLNGLASFSSFIALLTGGKVADAFAVLDARQKALSKNLVSPEMRMQGLEIQAKSRNKAVSDAAKAEIAALKKAEADTRAAYNRFSSLGEVGTKLGLNVYSTGEKIKGSDFVDKAALKAAAAAAAKAAKARADAIAKALASSLDEAKKQLALSNDAIKTEYEKSVALFDAQTQAIDNFKTQLGDVRGATQPLAAEGESIGRFAQSVIDSFDAIDKSVLDNKAIFDGDGQSLRDYVATEKVLLLDLAKQRDALAEKYSLAKAVKTDIEGAIRSFGNITNLLDKQSTQVTETMTTVVDGIQLTRTKLVEQTSTANIVANFQAILDKTKAFAVSLKKLRALGLDQNLYKQIVDAGVDAGGQTAEAILAGGSDTVASLNTIFKDLNSVGADIGEQTAQVMYGAGIDLTNGLLEGIKSKDQELMDQAKSMATLFADTFNSMVSKLIIQPTSPSAPSLAMQYPGFSDYINGALSGYSGDALASQIDMLTGANVSAPGSFMNSLGYMKSSPITVNVNAGMIANKQEIPAMIVDALGTYTKQSGAGGLTRVLGL